MRDRELVKGSSTGPGPQQVLRQWSVIIRPPITPAPVASTLMKEWVERRNDLKGCQSALCWPRVVRGQVGKYSKARRGAAPTWGETDDSPPGPSVGASGGQSCPVYCPEIPHGEGGAASSPVDACVHLQQQGQPAPKPDTYTVSVS